MSSVAGTDKNRRRFIKQVGLVALTVPLAGLVACGGSDSDNTVAGNSGSSGSGSSGSSSGDSSGGTTVTSDWAMGGTASMTANFPDDTLFALGGTCTLALTKALTEGPCYFAADVLDDISEEQAGLPMQLCLRVVDSSCNPLSGLEVEVWHCDVGGIYSGNTAGSADSRRFSSGFCTGNDRDALQAKWFRGIQVTDSNGRVNFKSCFPGWYSGRTIHIHFRVRNNNNDQVISQFCFDDSFTAKICTTHPEYSGRGVQDTTLSGGRDTVFSRDYEDFLFDTRQNDDGSLLAWKTIRLSS